MRWIWWISWSYLHHIHMRHPKEPPNVPVNVAPVALSYGTMCLLWYHTTLIIIKHGIHMYMCQSRMSRDNKMSRNGLSVVELPYHTLGKMRSNETWSASQPSRVYHYLIKWLCLMVIDMAFEVHVLGNQVVKIHSERLYRPVPSE